jgi:hypothetical protein
VYDASPTPGANDLLLTKANFRGGNYGTVNNFFDSLKARGYNVGLGVKPTNNTGSLSLPKATIGMILRPALNIKLHGVLFLYVGGYVTYQILNPMAVKQYRVIDNLGTKYSSMLNMTSALNSFGYGANIGIRIFMGHTKRVYAKGGEG